jgi:hypothetical protein
MGVGPVAARGRKSLFFNENLLRTDMAKDPPQRIAQAAGMACIIR